MADGVLPLFQRDRQMCRCGHICGGHGHTDEPMGIGLGACYSCQCSRFQPERERCPVNFMLSGHCRLDAGHDGDHDLPGWDPFEDDQCEGCGRYTLCRCSDGGA